MTNRYVKDDAIDEWAATRQAALVYPNGEPIEVWDQVDFGLDPRDIGIDPVEGPWVGTVTEIVLGAGQVLVDTFCNSIEAYSPDKLRLLHRPTEEEKAKEIALAAAVRTVRTATHPKEATQ